MFFNSVFKSCEKWWPWFWRIISCISIGHNHSFKQVKRTLVVPYHGYCPWITTTHEWFPWPRRGYSKMFYDSNVVQRLITLFASNCLGIGTYFFKAHRSPRHQSNSHPPSDGCCSEKWWFPAISKLKSYPNSWEAGHSPPSRDSAQHLSEKNIKN